MQGWAKNVVHITKSIELKLGILVDLIIVIDGSKKNTDVSITNQIKSELNRCEIIEYSENKGKGFALRTGIKSVHNFPIIYTDIDFPYTETSFIAIYDELKKGNDVVLGKRNTNYYSPSASLRSRKAPGKGDATLSIRRCGNPAKAQKGSTAQRGYELFLSISVNSYKG